MTKSVQRVAVSVVAIAWLVVPAQAQDELSRAEVISASMMLYRIPPQAATTLQVMVQGETRIQWDLAAEPTEDSFPPHILRDMSHDAFVFALDGRVVEPIEPASVNDVPDEGMQLVSNPSLSLADNQTARVSISEEVPYVVDSQGGEKTKFEEVGITMLATPRALPGGGFEITLDARTSKYLGLHKDTRPRLDEFRREFTVVIPERSVLVYALPDKTTGGHLLMSLVLGHGVPAKRQVSVEAIVFRTSKGLSIDEQLKDVPANTLVPNYGGETRSGPLRANLGIDLSHVEVVANPVIMTVSGQEATIEVGNPVQYFEVIEEERYELHHMQTDGLRLSVNPTVSGTSNVRVGYALALQWVAERAPVEGVSLDIGRPIFDQIETNGEFTIEDGAIALGWFPAPGTEKLFVALKTTIVGN